jgi:hypothetical protein
MSNIATNDILCVITHPAFDSQACAPNVYCMDKVDEVVIDQLLTYAAKLSTGHTLVVKKVTDIVAFLAAQPDIEQHFTFKWSYNDGVLC